MLRRLLLPLLVASLALPSSATWSVVVVNRRTGEVAVAAATCIPNTNLLKALTAINVGKGVGVIQASGDPALLPVIFAGFEAGDVPDDIMATVLAAAAQPRQHQIGIVSMNGFPATFTGSAAGRAKGGVIGEVGDLAYAIQGNVLTDEAVWLAAERALLEPGDLGQRVMAAMEAAQALGGDGRCSCPDGSAPDCGAPPPDGWEKSAHSAFFVVARHGDANSKCNKATNCAGGLYYLKLNIKGFDSAMQKRDPVFQLRTRYNAWRREHRGSPDGILSWVEAVQAMPADGLTTRTVTVHLADIDGMPLTSGGATLKVSSLDGPAIATIGPVTDHGDGSYSFELSAGTETGLDRFKIRADDGSVKATLYPYLEVRSDPPAALHAGYDQVSALAGAHVPFVVNVPTRADAFYMILGSMSGTEPGLTWGPFSLPLNPDRFTLTTLVWGGKHELLPGTIGRLDGLGRAEGALSAPPELLTSLVGLRLDWATVVLGHGWPLGTNSVGFDIVP